MGTHWPLPQGLGEQGAWTQAVPAALRTVPAAQAVRGRGTDVKGDRVRRELGRVAAYLLRHVAVPYDPRLTAYAVDEGLTGQAHGEGDGGAAEGLGGGLIGEHGHLRRVQGSGSVSRAGRCGGWGGRRHM